MDESCGCVFPWFTHPFLDVLKTWDISKWNILEYGGGRSTAWWRSKTMRDVFTVESNEGYFNLIHKECQEKKLLNGVLRLSEVNEGDRIKEREYVDVFDGLLYGGPVFYDAVVVDGIFRYECMKKGIELLSKYGGILIVDNWQQDGFVCPACAELVAPFQGGVYRQEDHTDHHGNPWQTAYWEIPAK
jgi:hypothetical protein